MLQAVMVRLPQGLVPVEFRRRLNRFAVEARGPDGGRPLYLHLANSGRMRELLVPGAAGLAELRAGPGRRTDGSLLLIRSGGRWVGLDAHLPNRLFAAGLGTDQLAPFRGSSGWRAEYPLDGERVDFLVAGPWGDCLVEVKSCNRVDDGVALFPDAPTARGTRHLRLLARRAAAGGRAAVVWIVQRDDAAWLRPFAEADPAFADAARAAAAAGVELYAYRCAVSPEGVALAGAIPVEAG
jgi:sugar fermentation stimulation protein A